MTSPRGNRVSPALHEKKNDSLNLAAHVTCKRPNFHLSSEMFSTHTSVACHRKWIRQWHKTSMVLWHLCVPEQLWRVGACVRKMFRHNMIRLFRYIVDTAEWHSGMWLLLRVYYWLQWLIDWKFLLFISLVSCSIRTERLSIVFASAYFVVTIALAPLTTRTIKLVSAGRKCALTHLIRTEVSTGKKLCAVRCQRTIDGHDKGMQPKWMPPLCSPLHVWPMCEMRPEIKSH